MNIASALLRIGAALVAGVVASALVAAQTYPDRPLRIVVPFPGGSNVDQMTRMIAGAMRRELGQPIVVEPMPGAGTVLAIQYVVRQPADGYTMVMVTNSGAIKSALPKPPFDIRRDLAFIGKVSSSPMFLAVSAALPVTNVKELIEHVRAHPGQLNMSSYGVGTLGHLNGELFMQLTGTKMVHVPYNGSTANGMALAQGTSQVTIEVLNTLRPHLQRGLVRIFAVCGPERVADAPDVPTVAESGIANFNASTWSGLAVPAGTPAPIIDKLSKAVAIALKDPAVLEFSQRTGLGSANEQTTPQAFAAMVGDNVAAFRNLIRDARLDIE